MESAPPATPRPPKAHKGSVCSVEADSHGFSAQARAFSEWLKGPLPQTISHREKGAAGARQGFRNLGEQREEMSYKEREHKGHGGPRMNYGSTDMPWKILEAENHLLVGLLLHTQTYTTFRFLVIHDIHYIVQSLFHPIYCYHLKRIHLT